MNEEFETAEQEINMLLNALKEVSEEIEKVISDNDLLETTGNLTHIPRNVAMSVGLSLEISKKDLKKWKDKKEKVKTKLDFLQKYMRAIRDKKEFRISEAESQSHIFGSINTDTILEKIKRF